MQNRNLSPVIALSIFDESVPVTGYIGNDSRVHVVVRSPEANQTHADVISVPTQRIPASLLKEILKTAQLEAKWDNTRYYLGGEVDNFEVSGHHPIIYAVESILSRKLGLSGTLELGHLRFRAALRVVMSGKSYFADSESCETNENLLMANIMVEILKGSDLFPPRTESYSYMHWTEVHRFLKTVREKDPLILGLNPIRYCIHGLCIATTYDLLAHHFGMQPYASSGNEP